MGQFAPGSCRDDPRWSTTAWMAPGVEGGEGLAAVDAAGASAASHDAAEGGARERLKAPQIAPLLGLEVRHTFQLFKEGKLPNRGKPRDVWCYRSDVEDELNRRRRQQQVRQVRQVRAAPEAHGSLRSHPAAAATDPAWLLHLGLSPTAPDAGAGAGQPPAGSTLPAEQLAAASLLDAPGITEGALRAILVRATALLALGLAAAGADPELLERTAAEIDRATGDWLALPPGQGRVGHLQGIARRLACKVTGLARLGLVRELGTG